VNLFDTADVYSLGDSERLLGEALRSLDVPRESYLIATKAYGPMGKGPNDRGASRGHLLDAVKGSLKRLGVDHIDLYQIHGFDPATPMEETLRTLDDLVRQGTYVMLACPTGRHGSLPKRSAFQRISAFRGLVLSRRITLSRGAIWSGRSSHCRKARELA
jgi:hypothetical protein